MNTKTQVILGFYSHYLNPNFTLPSFFKKLKTLIVFAMGISNLLAFNEAAYQNCNDTEKPVIQIVIGNCNPAQKDSASKICFGFLNLNATATDDQTGEDDLVFEYKIDIYNDGKGVYGGFDCWVGSVSKNQLKSGISPLHDYNQYSTNIKNPFDASGTYPIGIHKICWNVTDSCGNIATRCQLFEIKDCKAPTPYCLNGAYTVFMPYTGCITIWAKDLDRGSFDNCTKAENLKFYFNGDPLSVSITICCDDFTKAGVIEQLPVDVQMWVEDEEGNKDYCKSLIIVKDTLIICGGDPFPEITGKFFSIKNKLDTLSSKNVEMFVFKGINLQKEQTFAGGQYLFDLNTGIYTLKAEKNDEPFNYVSTYDMILIQKSILGFNVFSNIYQLYAADVNGSHTITQTDVSEIRKLILRNKDKFNNSQSWFIYPLVDPPQTIPSASIQVELHITEHRIIDFRAIKIGDVNDLISSDGDKLLIPNSMDSLAFNIVNRSIKTADTVIVDFYSKKFINILGYQYTIKFDTQFIKFIDVIQNNLSNSNKNNFGTRFIDSGFITTSWFNFDCSFATYKDDEVLFTLKFVAKKDGTICDLISITGDLTPTEAYRDSFLLKNIKLDVCDVLIKTKEETKDFCTAYPNPFQNEISFHFSDAVNFPVQIEIFSLEGKKIAVQQLSNEVRGWTWSNNQMQAGVYLIGIKDGRNIRYVKMIKK